MRHALSGGLLAAFRQLARTKFGRGTHSRAKPPRIGRTIIETNIKSPATIVSNLDPSTSRTDEAAVLGAVRFLEGAVVRLETGRITSGRRF